MQQEIRFATFNVCNLAPPGMCFYENLEPYTSEQYEAKIEWIARHLDALDADVIAFQEIFSQASLKDVLARTQKYRNAEHLGFDPDPRAERFTPNVALVSRLPIVGSAIAISDLPNNPSMPFPDIASSITRFTRPVLHARIQLSSTVLASVFVVHLKSKIPEYRNEESGVNPSHFGVAVLRSLIRRGIEALGLRYLLNDHMQDPHLPVIVMGDFNDVIGSVTTQLVLGCGRPGENGTDRRLLDSYRIQTELNSMREVGYTHVHEGIYETIDHILVSDAFDPSSGNAVGEIVNVSYINDHLVLRPPEATDHGIVLARMRVFPSDVDRASE